uniref:LysM domain-containing protein n=1 Tax=Fagus sylvatica TaxID=28930 RepID=A0A2N9G4F8_FAGSY
MREGEFELAQPTTAATVRERGIRGEREKIETCGINASKLDRDNEMGYSKMLLGLVLLITLAATSTAQPGTVAPIFKCTTTKATCHSLIDYVSPNTTTISTILSLFQIKRFRDSLRRDQRDLESEAEDPNPLPLSMRERDRYLQQKPQLHGKKRRLLYHIAAEIFSGLTTYETVALVNNISDPNKIDVGQKLWIPLPCSCDEVAGAKVVHYGHVVEAGSSVEKIAMTYGTTEDILLKLNGMVNASQLLAGQVLDVPLKACTSSVNSSSLDYPYLFPMALMSTLLTVVLQCEPSGEKPSSNSSWSTCPAVRCGGTNNLNLGDVATSTTCNKTFCAYAGYTKNTIFTTLSTESTCPAGAPAPSPSGTPGSNASPGTPGSDASKIGSQGLRLNFLFISIQLIFLCFHLSQ